jgi:K+-transporting ATPase ATPase C chain
MRAHLRSAGTLFGLLALLTGVCYPLLLNFLAQGFFPHQANGSLLVEDGRVVGCEWIGQPFDDPRYFWSRPSATKPPYSAASSAGLNLGPTNLDWLKQVHQCLVELRRAHPEQTGPVPVDLVTALASGLDPHISPAAAAYQVARVARARNLPVEQVRRLAAKHTAGPTGASCENRLSTCCASTWPWTVSSSLPHRDRPLRLGHLLHRQSLLPCPDILPVHTLLC